MRFQVWENACRDEQCPREDLHEAHAPIPLLGRTPKACPNCLKSLINETGLATGKCAGCGWARDGKGSAEAAVGVGPIVKQDEHVVASLSVWVSCAPCEGEGCARCSFQGFVPRLRANR